MTLMKENVVTWLGIEDYDAFLWSESFETTFKTFFEYVTFHDSLKTKFFFNDINEGILIIKLDSYWNTQYVEMAERISPWPYLIIKIPVVLNVAFFGQKHQDTIIQSESIIVSKEEKKRWLSLSKQMGFWNKEFLEVLKKNNKLSRTYLYDSSGGGVDILHEQKINILLIDESGKYINPNIEKLKPFEEIKEKTKTEKRKLSNIVKRILKR